MMLYHGNDNGNGMIGFDLNSSAGVALSASLSRLYARNDARALSVAQFKHCQTVLDSLATKVFKDDLQR
jgi:hypothetical protein